MAILNMTGGGKSVKVPLNDISTLLAIAGDTEATITWTDVGNLTVNGVLLNEWSATKLVRKIGSAPSDSSDGTLVTTSTTQDEYSVNGYPDTGLTNGTTYYYKAFSVGSNGLESGSNSDSVTPAQPGPLPAIYQEVEYISSADTDCKIDTGLTASADLSFDFYITPNLSYTSANAILGDWWHQSGIFFMFYNGIYRLHNGGIVADGPSATANKTHIEIDNTGYWIDGVFYSLTAGSSYTSGTNVALFNTMNNRGFGVGSVMSLYETKIWNSGTLIRDFIPCYRKLDSVIGMYDIVNDVFYTNTGSGTFTKGPDVN